MFQYILYKFGQFIIHCVPRQWAYTLAGWLSDQHYIRSNKDREAVCRNIRYISGTDDQLESKAKAVFRNFGRYLVDFFFMYQVDKDFVSRNVIIENGEALEQAKGKGRGVIILAAHIGNWEMGAAVLTKLGNILTAIALPHRQKLVNGLFNRQRMAHGVHVVPTSVAIRRCIAALKRGEMIALLGDRDFGNFGEQMMFLGRLTQIPKGAAFFALKTGAPIVPSFLVPDGKGKFALSFGDPIGLSSTLKDEAEIMRELMRQYISVVEKKIKEDPTQWLMFREFGVENEHLYIDTRT